MKKNRKRQEVRAANQPRTNGTTVTVTKGLPSIEETEAYIKEHGLKVINPLSDFGFKRLLATERNKDILIHLLNAFIASANGGERPSVVEWARRWHQIINAIDLMELPMTNYEQDKLWIDEVLAQGKYAISHSPEYREAYAPHYRIVRRDIFDREIRPLLPCPCCNH